MEYFLKICLIATTISLTSAGSRPKFSSDYILNPHSEGNSGSQLLYQVQPQQVISQSQQIQQIPMRTVTTSTLPQLSNFLPSLGLGIGYNQDFKTSSHENIFAKPEGLHGAGLSYLIQAGAVRPVGSSNAQRLIYILSGGGNSGASYEVIAPPHSKLSSEATLQNAGIGQIGSVGSGPSYYSSTGITEALQRPTPTNQNVAETIFLSNPGLSLLTSNSAGSLGIQYNSGNTPGQTLPTITRPFITVINKPVNDVSGSYFTNVEAIQAKPGFQYGEANVPSGLTMPNIFGGGGYGSPNVDLANIHMQPGVGGSSAHMNQVPCILHIPNPVPITIASGATQVTTPTLSSIPASYVDNSPPIVGVLRPPSSSESNESETVVAPTGAVEPSAPSSLLKTFVPKGKSSDDIQEDNNDELFKSQDDDHTIYQGLARNGLPLIYTLLPSASPSITTGTGGTAATSAPSSVPTSFRSKNRNPTSSSSSPPMSQRKNPFFNVNKRKHFEFYQYF